LNAPRLEAGVCLLDREQSNHHGNFLKFFRIDRIRSHPTPRGGTCSC
jgi:hypothetical protein